MNAITSEEPKKLNSAAALLAHIGLKTERLELFGASINVRQWTANERIQYLALISSGKGEEDTIKLLRPQAAIVALSLVDEKGAALFPVKEWQQEKPVFDNEAGVELFVQHRAQEVSDAFVKVAAFNGVEFNGPLKEDDEDEKLVKR